MKHVKVPVTLNFFEEFNRDVITLYGSDRELIAEITHVENDEAIKEIGRAVNAYDALLAQRGDLSATLDATTSALHATLEAQEAGLRLLEATQAQVSELTAQRDALAEAVRAREAYVSHRLDCAECVGDYDCDVAIELWDAETNLRSAALALVEASQ